MNAEFLDLERRHGSGVFGLRGIALVSGSGAEVTDADGKTYLDAMSQYGVLPLGHGHPALVAAIAGQAARLANCQGVFASDVRARYLAELAPLLPAGLERVFLSNSGTEAIEAAIKFARLTTERPGIVAAANGFHGRTLGALSATWNAKYRDPFQPLVPGFRHVPYGDLAALEAALARAEGGIAAVLLEIVQGEGGVRPGSSEYLLGAERLSRAHGALFIVDEVQTGFGRTGRMFACEHAGVEPDVLCLAKGIAGGLPMGATAFGPRVAALPVASHGSTFGGNPLACAAARATLRVLAEERLVEGAVAKGERFQSLLRSIGSPLVREVRGLGLMVGVDLRIRAQDVVKQLQDEGVLALTAGPTVVRFLPPLVISDEQLRRVVGALARVLLRSEARPAAPVAEGGTA